MNESQLIGRKVKLFLCQRPEGHAYSFYTKNGWETVANGDCGEIMQIDRANELYTVWFENGITWTVDKYGLEDCFTFIEEPKDLLTDALMGRDSNVT